MVATILGFSSLAGLSACGGGDCEAQAPGFVLAVVTPTAPPVRALTVTLGMEEARWSRTFEVTGGELDDGETSLFVELDPPPAGAFEADIQVLALEAKGKVAASGGAVFHGRADACNRFGLQLAKPDAHGRGRGRDQGAD